MNTIEIINGGVDGNMGEVPEVSSKDDAVSGVSETIRGQTEGVSVKPELVDFGGKMIPKKKAEELRRFINQCEGMISEDDVSEWIFFEDNERVGLRLRGTLDLTDCRNLESLPERLSVGGSLLLEGCTKLKSLPERLMVGGNLYLDHCTSLKTLPESLMVINCLWLSGYTGLYSLKTFNLLKRLQNAKKIDYIKGFPFDEFEYVFGNDSKLSELKERYFLLKENISDEKVFLAVNLVNFAIDIYDEYRKGFVDEFNKMKEESKKGNVDEKIISRGKEIKASIIAKRKELSGRLKAIFSQDLIDVIIEREKNSDVVRFFN